MINFKRSNHQMSSGVDQSIILWQFMKDAPKLTIKCHSKNPFHQQNLARQYKVQVQIISFVGYQLSCFDGRDGAWGKNMAQYYFEVYSTIFPQRPLADFWAANVISFAKIAIFWHDSSSHKKIVKKIAVWVVLIAFVPNCCSKNLLLAPCNYGCYVKFASRGITFFCQNAMQD